MLAYFELVPAQPQLVLTIAPSSGAPAGKCCGEKTVGEVVYTLVGEADTAQYGCLQNCIYENMNQGSQFCFRTGDLPVECLDDDQGNTGEPQEEGTPGPQGSYTNPNN